MSSIIRSPISDYSVQWIPLSGSNYEMVNEYPTPDDDDYNFIDAWATATDKFSYDAITLSDVVNIQVTVYVRFKNVLGTGNSSLSNLISVGGNTYGEDWAFEADSNWYTNSRTWDINPNSGLSWTEDDVNGIGENALEYFGYSSNGAFTDDTLYVSQAYLEVSYDVPPSPVFIYKGTIDVNEIRDFEYLTGKYYTIGSDPSDVYRFDDPDWTDIGGAPVRSSALLVFGGELYQGTYGYTSGTARVYKWDGISSWSQIGGNLSTNTSVYSIIEFDGKIYAGTNPSGKVYRLDSGPVWTDVGRLGTEVSIVSLAVAGGKLYGAGHNGKVYVYEGGTTWTAISVGNYVGKRLAVLSDELYGAGGTSQTEIKKYSGSGTSWIAVGSSLEAPYNVPSNIAVCQDKLYVSVQVSADYSKIYRYDLDWVYIQAFEYSVNVLKSLSSILWAGLNIGEIWSYSPTPTPGGPTTEELMRNGKWFRDGMFKGCWIGQ